MNILVVDDDKLNLRVADGYLKMFFPQFDINLCQDPHQAINLVVEKNIDILLLDIMMPGISGIDLLKLIRAKREFRDLQIIMLTALSDMESFKLCFELGANDFLKKPIEVTEFKARISAATNTRGNNLMLQEMYNKVKEQNVELKSVNAQLKDAQFHLIQSEKLAAIGELAAGVAHEINNPIGYVGSNLETMSSYLNKMKSFIQYFLDELDLSIGGGQGESQIQLKALVNEKYQKLKIEFILEDLDGMINDSKEGIYKVAEIVKSLRNFARTGMEDERTYTPFKEIISQVLLIVKNESKYTTVIEVEDQDVCDAYMNRGQISQVVLNIVINAIQAIKQQQRNEFGKISINTFEEEDFICMKITDDGPGISESTLNKIFDPFFTTKEVGQGTGLGLSISHDIIVNKHHGMLDVKSVVGEGTQFLIKLPRVKYEEVIE